MSDNLLFAYRNGAIPGVAVKQIAREDARVLRIVGPSVIGRGVTGSTLTLRPRIDRIVVKGIRDGDEQCFANFIQPRFLQTKSIESVSSVEEVARDADIRTITVTTYASGSPGYPYIISD